MLAPNLHRSVARSGASTATERIAHTVCFMLQSRWLWAWPSQYMKCGYGVVFMALPKWKAETMRRAHHGLPFLSLLRQDDPHVCSCPCYRPRSHASRCQEAEGLGRELCADHFIISDVAARKCVALANFQVHACCVGTAIDILL